MVITAAIPVIITVALAVGFFAGVMVSAALLLLTA